MKLFIHNQYQDALEIEIAVTAKVLDLKTIIAARINGIMVHDQILKYRSRVLDESDTIQSCGIIANSVIELTMKTSFNIFIKSKNNLIHKLDVNYSDSVELVKKMLNLKLNIEVDKQRLLYNDKELKNEDILTDKQVRSGTTLILKEINLNVQLNIVERSGQNKQITVPKSTTIAQLKQLISDMYKVPSGYQILTFNGGQLENLGKTLADCHIENLSEIHFRPADIEIFIQPSALGRNRISLRVLPIDTIDKVKDQIETELKINKSAQQLIWNGKVLSNDAIVSVENIQRGSTISLVITVQNLKLRIQIGPEDKIQIEVQSTETVAQLKAKLFCATKIPIIQQIIFVGNTKLEDDKMLIDYGVNETSDIALQRKDSFDILVETLNGSNIKIQVHKNDIVSDIKAQIDRRLGIKSDNQILLYFGKTLEDSKPLEDYKIDKNCTLHLTLRLPGGTAYKM